jgi:hypothetical protein
MTGPSGFAYAQARLQSRYGKRADTHIWLKLHNIHDLASYLQAAQQASLRPWALGISAKHSSHDIELALRQKYRHHVDEVANWLPTDWQIPLQWIKRLADLPALQYLLAGNSPLDWMKSDPDISKFTDDDPALRVRAMQEADCANLVSAWQQGDSMVTGWLAYWDKVRPQTRAYNSGLQSMSRLLHAHLLLNARQASEALPADYGAINDELIAIFRRYTFQPAAVCAYLAIVAIDVNHIRSDLMQRLFFRGSEDPGKGLSA